jgi:hypothetical protein
MASNKSIAKVELDDALQVRLSPLWSTHKQRVRAREEGKSSRPFSPCRHVGSQLNHPFALPSLSPLPSPPLSPITQQVVKGFCVKADGKDKLTALIQVRAERAAGRSERGTAPLPTLRAGASARSLLCRRLSTTTLN